MHKFHTKTTNSAVKIHSDGKFSNKPKNYSITQWCGTIYTNWNFVAFYTMSNDFFFTFVRVRANQTKNVNEKKIVKSLLFYCRFLHIKCRLSLEMSVGTCMHSRKGERAYKNWDDTHIYVLTTYFQTQYQCNLDSLLMLL